MFSMDWKSPFMSSVQKHPAIQKWILTVNHKWNLLFFLSRWVVCFTSILSIICSVYTVKCQKCCFPPWTFQFTISDPFYIWFWFPWCCTADIDWGSLTVICFVWWNAYLWCLCRKLCEYKKSSVRYQNKKITECSNGGDKYFQRITNKTLNE